MSVATMAGWAETKVLHSCGHTRIVSYRPALTVAEAVREGAVKVDCWRCQQGRRQAAQVQST
jgi:hypothetical protein